MGVGWIGLGVYGVGEFGGVECDRFSAGVGEEDASDSLCGLSVFYAGLYAEVYGASLSGLYGGGDRLSRF